MSHPVDSALSPHSGLIHPTAAHSIAQPHLPSSPMPCMFSQEEPARVNKEPASSEESSSSSQLKQLQHPPHHPSHHLPSHRSAHSSAGPSPAGQSMMLAPPSFSSGSSSSDGGLGRGSFSLSNSSSSSISISTTFNNNGGGNNGAPVKKFRIYYCLEMEAMARELVRLDDRCVLGEIDWKCFADGFPNLFIHNADSVKNYHVIFLANFHSPAVFFEQFSVITMLPKLLPKSFKLFLPFFPTGTMERVSRLGEVATANSLARILSTIPNCSKGPAQICIFDIHALQNQFYFRDTVLIRLGTCVNLLLERLALLPDRANVNICFPDDGAAKRFGDMFQESYPNIIICHKVRGEGEKRVVKLKEGAVAGRHCVIVDDLVQSGSTLLECAKELLKNGAACVSAYVTHAIFPNTSYKKFFKAECKDDSSSPSTQLKHFWVTDTNPNVTERLRGQEPFEVLSIAQNIREIILDEEKQG